MTRVAIVAIACALAGCPKREKPRSTTTLAITVTDVGKPVGARVLLFDAQNQPVHIGTIDLYGKRQGAGACAIAQGVLGSWDGLILAYGSAEVPIGVDTCVPSPAIKYGRYHVWAWRGIEYERWEGDVDLSPNSVGASSSTSRSSARGRRRARSQPICTCTRMRRTTRRCRTRSA